MRFPEDVPTLTAGPVTLRAARPEDADGVLEQCCDPLSRQWTTVPLDYTREMATEFLTESIPEGWRSEQSWTFVVEVADAGGGSAAAGRFAGTISLRNEGERRAEVAYGAAAWVRGRGVMEQAVRLLLQWGFDRLGLLTVIWWANSGNWASRKLAWRVGFGFGGELRQWLPQRGALLDAWVGVLLAGEPMEPRTPWYDVPRLVGADVVLRRHERRDADRIVEACTDPGTRRWLGSLPVPYGRADADYYLATREETHAAGTAVNWAMADPGTDELVGSINLFDIAAGRQAELGYWVHPSARRRGIATQAVRLVLRHAFVSAYDGGLDLVRVRALAAVENTGSRTVLERVGMSLQGRERLGTVVQDGRLADVAVYDILAKEFVGVSLTR